MSRNVRSKRPRRGLQTLLCILIALVLIGILGKIFVIGPLKEKVADKMAKQLIQSQLSSDTGLSANIDTEEILDSMSEEDRETLHSIVSDNISPETMREASSYLANGDTQGLKEYAKESLSDEELQQIRDLYSKYKDQIEQNMQ